MSDVRPGATELFADYAHYEYNPHSIDKCLDKNIESKHDGDYQKIILLIRKI